MGKDNSITLPFIYFLKRFYLFIPRERGRERERQGEKHRRVRDTSIGCLQHTLCPETRPTTQACALMGESSGQPSAFSEQHPSNRATAVRAPSLCPLGGGLWGREF